MSTRPAYDAARQVADAVLYEGYLLYPYRASSSKNQVRWQFGVVSPVGAEEAGAGEAPSMFTECLLQPTGDQPSLDVTLRFLQVQWRAVERSIQGSDTRFEPVSQLHVGAARWIPWHEAVEREITLPAISLEAARAGHVVDLAMPGGEEVELIHDAGALVGRLVRTRWALRGQVTVTARPATAARDAMVLRISVDNTATWEPDTQQSAAERQSGAERDLAARQSFVGAHVLVGVEDGTFVSVVDPPDWAATAAGQCTNSRCWPVMMGVEGEQTATLMLGSPIILPENPVVADESPGDLYDATEIDEILTLRIMTMTAEEKTSARGTDPRAAAIIDRSDDMPPEIFSRLHGALRGFDPWAGTEPNGSDASDSGDVTPQQGTEPRFDDSEIPTFGVATDWFTEAADASVAPETDLVIINGVSVSKGSRVRLRPRRRADAHDMFLADQTATVARIDRDVDGVVHVAVLLEDDPARELHEWYGRFYYFGAEEVEPLTASPVSRLTP